MSAALYLWNSTIAIATARLPSKALSKEIDHQKLSIKGNRPPKLS
jgi:hypothetical protein